MVNYTETFMRLVSAEYRQEIGQVCVQWSLLESLVENCIWQCAELRNDLGRITTSQMMMMNKLDLLASLLHQTQPEISPPFDKVANYIRENLVGRRNLFVHGFWYTEKPEVPEMANVSKFSSKGKLVSQGRTFHKTELDSLSADIAETSAWLMTLSHRLPSLRKRPGGLGHVTRDLQSLQEYAIRRQQALQPLPSLA